MLAEPTSAHTTLWRWWRTACALSPQAGPTRVRWSCALRHPSNRLIPVSRPLAMLPMGAGAWVKCATQLCLTESVLRLWLCCACTFSACRLSYGKAAQTTLHSGVKKWSHVWQLMPLMPGMTLDSLVGTIPFKKGIAASALLAL